MNEIYGMELKYESLIPIDRPKDTFLSVGTVTFLIEGKELPLNFTYHDSGTLGLRQQHLTMISLRTTILTPIWRKYTRNTFIRMFQKRFICRLP